MKHRTSGRKFGRNRQGRHALFVGLTRSLVHNGRITTTQERAKTLQSFVEKLFTSARRRTLEGQRSIQRILQNSEDIKKMLSIAIAAPPARSFTQLTKGSIRKGDAARLAEIKIIAPAILKGSTAPAEKAMKGTKPS